MDCEVCRGSPLPGMVITPSGPVHCPNHCIGSIASCCDAAGSAQPELRPNAAKAGDIPAARDFPSTWRPGWSQSPAVILR